MLQGVVGRAMLSEDPLLVVRVSYLSVPNGPSIYTARSSLQADADLLCIKLMQNRIISLFK